MATTSWSYNPSDAYMGTNTNTYDFKGPLANGGLQPNNNNFLNAGSVTQITFSLPLTRDFGGTAGRTTVYPHLYWGTENTAYNMDSMDYPFSGKQITRTSTATFDENTSPTCYEMANKIRQNLMKVNVTYSPKAQSNSTTSPGRIRYHAPITLTVTYDTINPIHYYHDNAWENCCAYYYDGTNWILCNPYYYNGSGFQNLG